MRTKVIVLSWLLLLPAVLFSQTEKGTFMLSGRTSLDFVRNVANFSYDGHSVPDGNIDMNSFNLFSDLGYFVANNFVAGLSCNYSFSSSYPSSGEKVKTGELILMPTLIYFIPLESALRPFIQAGGGYANVTEEAGGEKQFLSGFAYGAGAGMAYFINDNFSVDFGIVWTATKLKYSEDSSLKLSGNNLGAAIGFSLFL